MKIIVIKNTGIMGKIINYFRYYIKIDWIAAILLWIGNYLLIYQKSWIAFVIFLFANMIWAVYWLRKKEWAAMILVLTFIIQNILGIIEWTK